MRYVIILIATVLVVVVSAGVYFWMAGGEPVQAARAARSEIRQFVDERATTRLPQVHTVTMPFAGRIESIALREGDPVDANQVVARIVSADVDDAVAEAQAAVDRLTASIAENDDVSIEESTYKQAVEFVRSMAATVAAAEARVEAGQERLDYSGTYLGRVRQFVPTGGKTQDDLDRAELDYAEDKINLRQDELVHTAASAIEAATRLLPQMVRDYIARKALARAVLEEEKSEAEARLRQMLTRRERSVMKSPVKGVVLKREIESERHLAAGEVLLEIGRLDELEVEADVLSQDVADVAPGDEAEIYGPAIGAAAGEGVAGVVHRIYPAGFTKVSSLGVEQQRVKVIVRFAPGVLDKLQNRQLGIDYRVSARIFTDRASGALLVPRSALFRAADGGWEVFAIRGGRAVLQPVDIGLMNDENVQVTRGLDDGEGVVLAPESSLTDGNRVRPIFRE